MEIRKFIIELHPCGKVSWNEYEEPRDHYTHKEWEDVLSAALLDVQHFLNSYPACTWDENEKILYIRGAIAMKNELRNMH